MTVFLIFVFFGFFFLLLTCIFMLFCLVSDRARLVEVCVCILGLLLVAIPTIAVAWNVWQRIRPN